MSNAFLHGTILFLRKRAASLIGRAIRHRFAIGAFVLVLFTSAFLVEYFAFGSPLRSLPAADRGTWTAPVDAISADGFRIGNDGSYVSEFDTSAITIRFGSRHVENLIVDLSPEAGYGIDVSVTDSRGKNTTTLKDLTNSMTKGGFSFLPSITFPIRTTVDTVTIAAKTPGINISGITVDNTYRFNPFRFAFMIAIGAIAASLFVLRNRIADHPEYAFLVVILVTGTLFSFSEPRSYTSWDEFIHYKRSDKVALKEFFPKTVNDIYAGTNSVPYSYSRQEQSLIDDHFDHDYKKTVSKRKSGDDMSRIGRFFELFTRIAYLPSGMTILAGRTLHVPRHVVFVLAQWINLLVFATLIFSSIRRLKTGKLLLASVALLPTSVFLASNYSYDSWVTGFIALGLSMVFTSLQEPEQRLTRSETFVMIGSLVLGCAPKAIYFPVMLPLFLLPRTAFASAKRYRSFLITGSVALSFVIASFAVPFLVSGSDFSDGRGGSGVDAIGQARFILSDPLAYTVILTGFLKEYLNPVNFPGLTTSFAYLGNMSGFFPLLSLLVFVAMTDRNAYDAKTGVLTRWVMLGITAVTIVLIATSLYVSFNPVGNPVINGVQPRYLLPLAFPALFMLGYSKFGIPSRFRNRYGLVVFGILSLILVRGIWDLVVSLHY